jgi:ribulose-phosphate 3-epimerase
MPLLAPSILAADFARLGEAVELINRSEADWVHCDVMDGRFVPNLSFGLPVVEAVKRVSRKPLDVHLMIVEPEKYIPDFIRSGADLVTFHLEATAHADRALQLIHSLGAKAGVAINPATPASLLEHLLPQADLVLLMSVNPGFGGQSFLPYVAEKVAWVAERAKPGLLIEVDGGIQEDTARLMCQCGANVLVAGSYVFGDPQPEEKISRLKRIAQAI